jgi:putative FmdB family regulatory protein
MPLYDYRCSACNQDFEVLEGAAERTLRSCPDCDSASIHRLIPAPAMRVYTQHMTDGERLMHRKHKEDIEAAHERGALDGLRGKAPSSEFEPKFPKRFH